MGGPRERAPKGPKNHANFKVISSSDPEVETVKLCSIQNTFLCEELKGCSWQFPRVAPMCRGGGGGGGGGNVFRGEGLKK